MQTISAYKIVNHTPQYPLKIDYSSKLYSNIWKLLHSIPSLSTENKCQNPQWMSETMGNTEPYIYIYFPIPTYLW